MISTINNNKQINSESCSRTYLWNNTPQNAIKGDNSQLLQLFHFQQTFHFSQNQDQDQNGSQSPFREEDRCTGSEEEARGSDGNEETFRMFLDSYLIYVLHSEVFFFNFSVGSPIAMLAKRRRRPSPSPHLRLAP